MLFEAADRCKLLFTLLLRGLPLCLVSLSFCSGFTLAEPQFISASNALIIKKVAETHLQAKPAKCVALNEGRTCYAKVVFYWQSIEQKPMCIYQKQPKKKIVCWYPPAKKELIFDFESNKNQYYQLINQDGIVLAETLIEVNWVYDSGPRKRRWRVF